jgi:hypothetical protein
MKTLYILLSLPALVYGSICFYFNSRDIYVAKYGRVVQARITYLPTYYSLKSGGPVHFIFEDVEFSENFPKSVIGDKKVGDFMLFYYMDKYSNNFVYIDKNITLVIINVAVGFVVIMCGIYLIYRAFWGDL